jgi:hypothetical protein
MAKFGSASKGSYGHKSNIEDSDDDLDGMLDEFEAKKGIESSKPI